jgi:hypothetical protein
VNDDEPLFRYCLPLATDRDRALATHLGDRCSAIHADAADLVLATAETIGEADAILGFLRCVARKTIVVGTFPSSSTANYRMPGLTEYVLEHHQPLGLLAIAGEPPTVRRFFGPRALADQIWKQFWTPTYADWIVDDKPSLVEFLSRLVFRLQHQSSTRIAALVGG